MEYFDISHPVNRKPQAVDPLIPGWRLNGLDSVAGTVSVPTLIGQNFNPPIRTRRINNLLFGTSGALRKV